MCLAEHYKKNSLLDNKGLFLWRLNAMLAQKYPANSNIIFTNFPKI